MRTSVRILFAVIGMLLLLLALFISLSDKFFARLGLMDVRYQLSSFSTTSAQFATLQFSYYHGNYRSDVAIKNADIRWQFNGSVVPRIQQLLLPELAVATITVAEPIESETRPFTLPDLSSQPHFLPQHISIPHAIWLHPCQQAEGCLLNLSLTGKTEAQRYILDVAVKNTPEPTNAKLEFLFGVKPSLQLVANAGEFAAAELSIVQMPQQRIGLRGDIGIGRAGVHWPEFLDAWLVEQNRSLIRQLEQPIDISVETQFDLARLAAEPTAKADVSQPLKNVLQRLDGYINLNAHLPEAVYIEGLGSIQGDLIFALAMAQGQWQSHTISVNAKWFETDSLALLKEWDLQLDQVVFTLTSQADLANGKFSLPITATLSSLGSMAGEVKLQATLLPAQQLKIDALTINMKASDWQPRSDISLKDLRVDECLMGQVSREHVSLDSCAPAVINGSIQLGDITAEQLMLELNTWRLEGATEWQSLTGKLEGVVAIDTLSHPLVNPGTWQWQGQAEKTLNEIAIAGSLTVNHGLSVSHKFLLEDKSFKLALTGMDSFFIAGNPLQSLLPQWPELLTFNKGRVRAEVTATGTIDQLVKSNVVAKLRLNDVSGYFDTTVFTGLNGELTLGLADERISAASSNITLADVDKAFRFEQVKLNGRYSAPIDRLTEGTLRLQSATANLLNGKVVVEPAVLDFEKEQQRLLIQLTAIDLQALLKEHPTADLYGTGLLSGQIPLLISKKGFSVEQGILAADEKGGQIQYRSDKVAAMAANNDGMKIVAEALNDFHYTVLSSGVTYDEQGKLLLGVRLEGSNPAVENGRAINFNITLEEDLPALLASLQLSGQLNDVIKKRVQQKIQARNQP